MTSIPHLVAVVGVGLALMVFVVLALGNLVADAAEAAEGTSEVAAPSKRTAS